MKNECKSHINATTISTWWHAMSFQIEILCDVFKVTKEICDHM
jgi:hypothetical protein